MEADNANRSMILRLIFIVSRSRRMFPALITSVTGLDPDARYSLFIDVIQADGDRYKYLNSKWIVVGKADREVEPRPRYVHPESPSTGQHWMSQKISFKKLKLTNNKKNTQGHVRPDHFDTVLTVYVVRKAQTWTIQGGLHGTIHGLPDSNPNPNPVHVQTWIANTNHAYLT